MLVRAFWERSSAACGATRQRCTERCLRQHARFRNRFPCRRAQRRARGALCLCASFVLSLPVLECHVVGAFD